MKVIYTGKTDNDYDFLTNGKVYDVSAYPHSKLYEIVADDGQAFWFDPKRFEIVSGSVEGLPTEVESTEIEDF